MTTTKPAIDLNAMLTVEEFADWQQVQPSWVRNRLASLPGVIRESRKHVRIHPKTYIESRLKRKI